MLSLRWQRRFSRLRSITLPASISAMEKRVFSQAASLSSLTESSSAAKPKTTSATAGKPATRPLKDQPSLRVFQPVLLYGSLRCVMTVLTKELISTVQRGT